MLKCPSIDLQIEGVIRKEATAAVYCFAVSGQLPRLLNPYLDLRDRIKWGLVQKMLRG